MSLVEIAAFLYYSHLIVWLPISFLLYIAFGVVSLYKANSIPLVVFAVSMDVISTVQACLIIGVLVRYVLCIRKRCNEKRINSISKKVQIRKYSIGLLSMLISGLVVPKCLFYLGYISCSFFASFIGFPLFVLSFITTGLCSNFGLRRVSHIPAQFPLLGDGENV